MKQDYDPKLIAEACTRLDEGCHAFDWDRNGNGVMCGRPCIALRRWTNDEGYDYPSPLPDEGLYDGVCRRHVTYDVIPLATVLRVMSER